MADPTSVEEIGARLVLTRRALGVTQAMMGQLMGSVGTGQAWENYEAGRRRISIDHANALTQSCGIPLDWVYQGQMANLPPQLRERIQQLMLESHRSAQSPTTRKSRRK